MILAFVNNFCPARKLQNKCYIYGSMHRCSISVIVQQDATQSSLFIILQVHSTCFGCQTHPSSGEHKTSTTASGTVHIYCEATFLQSGQDNLATLEGTCRLNLQNNK